MRLSIVTEAPAWYTFICVLAGVLFSVLMYFRDKRLTEIPKWLVGVMAVLRGITVSVLAFLLLSPLLRTTFREVEKPVIVLAQDESASLLLGRDSAFNANEYPAKFKALADALSDKYEVRTYAFGDHFRENADLRFNDKLTNFSDLFDEIRTRYSDRNLGAVIIASDGIYNEGQSPVYAAEDIKAPVFTIAMGDTTVRKDLVLTKVVHNRIAFLGNTFPMELVIDAHRCKGEKAILSVSKGGQNVLSQPLQIENDPFNVTIPVQLTANATGLQRYTVALSVLDDESNVHNNTQDVYIDVLDAREKILIVGAHPHPDMGALRQSIEKNDNYEVDEYTLDKFDQQVSKYNMAILHSIPSADAAGDKLLSDLAAAKVPVFYITGTRDRYQSFNALNTGVMINAGGARANDCEAVPSKDFPLFNISDALLDYIPKMPAVTTPFGNFQTAPSATVLMKQKIGSLKTDYPLWIFGQQGERKVSVFIGEGLWKWRLHDFADHGDHALFDELVGKTVQYLSVREDRSFFRVSVKNDFLENEPVVFDAEVYNQSYELINAPEVKMDIIDESGKRYPALFSRTAHAYHYDARQLKTGQYKYDANVKVGDKTYRQSGTFSVSPLMIENANSTADHHVLYDLAHRHNGEMFLPSETARLLSVLNSREDIKPVIYNPRKLVDLINIGWVFALLMVMLSAEWFLRKRYGAY